MKPDACAIGVDLGGTKTALGLVDAKGNVLEFLRFGTDVAGGPAAVRSQVTEGVAHLVARAGSLVAGVGIGVAGQIDPVSGLVRFAPNLGWHNFSLRPEIEAAAGVRVTVTNDVRAALYGEWLFGAGVGFDDLICVFVGTGIGGGIVCGGRVLAGCTNTAGEVGHITIALDGPVCNCGKRGCLEALAGGWAIARAAQQAAIARPEDAAAILDLAEGKFENITARAVVDACHAGDALSRELMDGAAEALAAGVVSLVNAFNPCKVLLGGGIVESMPELVGRVDARVRVQALAAATGSLEIAPARLGSNAGIIGAAALAMTVFGESVSR
jgi:glucokinase